LEKKRPKAFDSNYQAIALILKNEHRDIEIAEKCQITRERVRQIRNRLKKEGVLPDPYSEKMIEQIVSAVAGFIRKENQESQLSNLLTRKNLTMIKQMVEAHGLREKIKVKQVQTLGKPTYYILKALIDGMKPIEVADKLSATIGFVRQVAWNAQQAGILKHTYKPREKSESTKDN